MFLPHPRVKVSIVGSLRGREVACSASDRQGSNFESCVWRTVSSHSSHHPQEVLLAQFSLYVHKSGLKPDSFHLFPNEQASPGGSYLIRLRPETQRYLVRISNGSDVCYRVVHIQCLKLFNSMKCVVLSMVLCTIKDPCSHLTRVGHRPDHGLPNFMIVPKRRCE